DGAENPSALSEADKQKIADQIAGEVLYSNEHPRVVFSSSSVTRRADGGYSVAGELTLHGVTRPLHAETQLEGDRQITTLQIHQPDYGITPFKAMMGTLKVKADVSVRLSVPSL